MEFAGDPAEVVRDAHGIAKGGIRLPQADVPLAQNSAIPLADDVFAYLRGSSHPFTAEKLRALYGDKSSFLAKFRGRGATRGCGGRAAAARRCGIGGGGGRQLARLS